MNATRWISAGPALPSRSAAASPQRWRTAARPISSSARTTARRGARRPDALAALDALPSPQHDGYVAQLRRGWLLYKLGKHAEAIDAYGRAIALEPRSVEARVGALLPAMALRRWADVEAGAREVLKLDPGNYLANLRLAFAVYNQGRYPRGRRHLPAPRRGVPERRRRARRPRLVAAQDGKARRGGRGAPRGAGGGAAQRARGRGDEGARPRRLRIRDRASRSRPTIEPDRYPCPAPSPAAPAWYTQLRPPSPQA